MFLELVPYLLAQQSVPPPNPDKTSEESQVIVIQEQEAIAPSPTLSIAPPEAIVIEPEAAIAIPNTSPTELESSAMPAPQTSPEDEVIVEAIEEVAPSPSPSLVAQPSPVDPADTTEADRVATRKRLLEERLAESVERDKAAKTDQLQQNLMATAINYAEAGQFEQAREVAQHPALSVELQMELMAQINAIASEQQPAIASTPTTECDANPADAACFVPKTPQVKPSFRSTPRSTATRPSITSIERLPAVPLAQLSPGQAPGQTTASGSLYSSRLTNPLTNSLSQLRQGINTVGLRFPLPFPVPMTSSFGWRVHPISGDRRFHSGIDLGADQGTPVLAASAGKVTAAEFMGGYGLAVAIEHSQNRQETLYAHLSEILVKPGQQVTQGTVIGLVGSTGNSTGPHLHFELRELTPQGWVTLDPGDALERASTTASQPEPPQPKVNTATNSSITEQHFPNLNAAGFYVGNATPGGQ